MSQPRRTPLCRSNRARLLASLFGCVATAGLVACRAADSARVSEQRGAEAGTGASAKSHTLPALEPERFGPGTIAWATDGADADAPLVVVLHGMGDRPESFRGLFASLRSPARFVALRAPSPRGSGYSWFAYRRGMTADELAREVDDAADRLWRRLEPWVGDGAKLVVTGFSQGGMLSFALAARHPTRLTCALPVAGALPPSLWPTPPAEGRGGAAPPVRLFALHGEADDVVPYAEGRRTVDAFVAARRHAELAGFPGVGHSISPAMRASLEDALARCVR